MIYTTKYPHGISELKGHSTKKYIIWYSVPRSNQLSVLPFRSAGSKRHWKLLDAYFLLRFCVQGTVFYYWYVDFPMGMQFFCCFDLIENGSLCNNYWKLQIKLKRAVDYIKCLKTIGQGGFNWRSLVSYCRAGSRGVGCVLLRKTFSVVSLELTASRKLCCLGTKYVLSCLDMIWPAACSPLGSVQINLCWFSTVSLSFGPRTPSPSPACSSWLSKQVFLGSMCVRCCWANTCKHTSRTKRKDTKLEHVKWA